MRLSEHFDLPEFLTSSSHPDLVPRPEDVPSEIVASLTRLCHEILEPLREEFGPVHVLSGYRTRELNHAVGGSPTSQHVRGEAADITVSAGPRAAFRWLRDSSIVFGQAILYVTETDEERFLHVSLSASRVRQALINQNGSLRAAG